ncbi:HWE histidine kinase domain-containing protein [Devosia sp. 63-57]|uniref:sensor histidine kinase n=1 Tax=Devosia sp. 63-57 TaxID=1895751 RepID=UPI00086AE89D|nr:HWE histidine kinase domain-containing protein [Devosia sp. 63-57]ODT50601.1 MAG: hypothetical protein ABS74_03575 [Pelagibacterium sp. SCN 63-126]ODU83475.1 MAG: hypothetical protein ABT14_15800 [Pelagibacterium sp. SCN 63-17]OJX45450.1 MAG: hypothetical protein BGO80_06475 [Devosia sp. 63-57]
MAEVDYERIFEALPSPFMIVDTKLAYVAVNAAYTEAVGRHREALVGRNLFDLFPNDDESGIRLKQSLERVIATGERDTLAYLPYPIASDQGVVENRYWTAVHVPITGPDGKVAYVMQNTVDVTDFARIREAESLPFTSLHAETRLLERTREAEEAVVGFRRLFQQAPAFFAVLTGPDHVFTFASDSYARLVGGRNVVGMSVASALPEVVGQGFVDLLDRVYREGYIHNQEGARVMLVREAGGIPEETFLDFAYHPIRDAEGGITGVFVQGMDRTEAVRAARQQRLLIDELNHRVKNTLAAVQSIASQTLRATADPQQARRAFEARIMALSKAHSLLSERQWHDTEIGTLIGQQLSAFGDGRVEQSGPTLMLNSKATIALALLVHELGVNAARHGSLSVPQGRIYVDWSQAEDGRLVLHWRERGGPPTGQPDRTGFGTRLLNSVVAGELGGELNARYEPDGFAADFEIPPQAYSAAEFEHV